MRPPSIFTLKVRKDYERLGLNIPTQLFLQSLTGVFQSWEGGFVPLARTTFNAILGQLRNPFEPVEYSQYGVEYVL